MQFKLSFKPEKYELSLYEILKVAIKAVNNEENPKNIQSIKNIVPKGFETIKCESVPASSFRPISNKLKVNIKLSPGESKILASLLLIPMTPSRATYSPIAILDEKRKIGEREILVSHTLKDIEKSSLFTFSTDDVIEGEPGNLISTKWSLKPSWAHKVEYVLLLNVLPPKIIEEVKGDQETFRIGEKHLLFLKHLKPNKKQQLPLQFRIKPLQELKPLVTKKLEKQMKPTLIAKTNKGIIKTNLNASYSFKINTTPQLLPPTLKITNLKKERGFFETQSKEKRIIFLETKGKIKYTLTIRKESNIPITGIRITNFLPKAFKILETRIDTKHQKDRSYIQIPKLAKKRFSLNFIAKTPSNNFRSLINPEIYCNEVSEKVRLLNPPLVKVCPKDTIDKPGISLVSWNFIPNSPFTSNTQIRSKLVMENPGSFPIKDLHIAFKLPRLEFKKIIKNTPSLEREKSTLHGDYIAPHEHIEAKVLFKSGKVEQENISGKCIASWKPVGESDTKTITNTKQYTIRKDEKEFLDKLQFWKP